MLVAKGTVKEETMVILEETAAHRAVAYIYRDGSGRVELHRKYAPESDFVVILSENRTREWMQEQTLIEEANNER